MHKTQQLASDFAAHMAESMDWDTMFVLVLETLRGRYEALTEQELLAEVREYAPHLIDAE